MMVTTIMMMVTSMMVIDIVFVTCFTDKTETQEGPCETFLFL